MDSSMMSTPMKSYGFPRNVTKVQESESQGGAFSERTNSLKVRVISD